MSCSCSLGAVPQWKAPSASCGAKPGVAEAQAACDANAKLDMAEFANGNVQWCPGAANAQECYAISMNRCMGAVQSYRCPNVVVDNWKTIAMTAGFVALAVMVLAKK